MDLSDEYTKAEIEAVKESLVERFFMLTDDTTVATGVPGVFTGRNS